MFHREATREGRQILEQNPIIWSEVKIAVVSVMMRRYAVEDHPDP
jgi:hypothetical protein